MGDHKCIRLFTPHGKLVTVADCGSVSAAHIIAFNDKQAFVTSRLPNRSSMVVCNQQGHMQRDIRMRCTSGKGLMGLAVSAKRIFLISLFSRAIVALSYDGEVQQTFDMQRVDDRKAELFPIGIAVSPAGELFVAVGAPGQESCIQVWCRARVFSCPHIALLLRCLLKAAIFFAVFPLRA